ncbi:MAG TPA: flagellar hook-basal body complex protein FliE, partial [Lachnospiraceae bacterium]|nr:flagellar hook-basal body complex protein FliE [Lachnospiraceae bacterium]
AMGISENTHDLSIAAAKASTALSYTVALRDRFIEAYRELMQIQV